MQTFLDHLYGFFKPVILFIVTFIVSIFSPVREAMMVLGLAFLFNLLTGLITDIHVNRKEFSLKKAFDAVIQLSFFGALIFFIQAAGTNLHDPTLAATGVKWVTYIVVYFYLTNILRNATQIFPKNQAISFMYTIMSTQIFSKLKEMIGIKSSDNDNKNPE